MGKTTLVKAVAKELNLKTLLLNGDERGDWWNVLTSRELSKIQALVSGYELLIVDEAQRIPDVSLILKIILDNCPHLKVIITGSSSLDIASTVSEPLTGRVYSYKLLPIAQTELAHSHTSFELRAKLEEYLTFGSYPEVLSLAGAEAKTRHLTQLSDSYLYKDLLEFGDIKNSSKIRSLLKLLAFQIGSEVSIAEVGRQLELSSGTVSRYIDLLEQSFVIFRLSGLSRNKRKEVTKMDKIYFYDNGVRNALIGNLNYLVDRNDGGQLWENFMVVERMKKTLYEASVPSYYFWRLTSGAEIDLIEEHKGKLNGFEFKFSNKIAKVPKSWQEAYPDSQFATFNKENYLDLIL